MQMISERLTVITIVGLALAGQTMVLSQLQPDGTFIAHPEPTEAINRKELVLKLNDISTNDNREVLVSEQVTKLLYSVAAKESTQVVAGVFVDELIEQNTFNSLADCSTMALKRRVDMFDQTIPPPRSDTSLHFAINVYVLRCLHLATEFCLKNRQQIITENIHDAKWMKNLAKNFFWDGQANGVEESYNELFVKNTFRPNVAHFIEHDPAEAPEEFNRKYRVTNY